MGYMMINVSNRIDGFVLKSIVNRCFKNICYLIHKKDTISF